MIFNNPLISFSVVSHDQSQLVAKLLDDLDLLPFRDFEVIITSNLPEATHSYEHRRYPVKLISNRCPKGFGSNHNAAFEQSSGRYFAVVNPDIRVNELDCDALLKPFDSNLIGALAPVIVSPEGKTEDSARRFPTAKQLVKRVLLRGHREMDYRWSNTPIEVDWVAGMFIVFRPEAFREVRGFDEKRFFMYFEDVDICKRLWRSGWSVLLNPNVSAIHQAQRASHRNLKHLYWHITSAMKYLIE